MSTELLSLMDFCFIICPETYVNGYACVTWVLSFNSVTIAFRESVKFKCIQIMCVEGSEEVVHGEQLSTSLVMFWRSASASIKGTKKRRACMYVIIYERRRCKRGVHVTTAMHSKWRSIVSAYPSGR